MDNYRVLLVDDEEELVSTLVERLGYRGVVAEFALSGNEALQKIREKTFDVVVIDLKMPGMSGVEVMKIIKLEQPAVSVLLITGHGAPSDELEDIPEGITDCLSKPINIEDLIGKMTEVLQNK